jgi:hypothetical protein
MNDPHSADLQGKYQALDQLETSTKDESLRNTWIALGKPHVARRASHRESRSISHTWPTPVVPRLQIRVTAVKTTPETSHPLATLETPTSKTARAGGGKSFSSLSLSEKCGTCVCHPRMGSIGLRTTDYGLGMEDGSVLPHVHLCKQPHELRSPSGRD